MHTICYKTEKNTIATKSKTRCCIPIAKAKRKNHISKMHTVGKKMLHPHHQSKTKKPHFQNGLKQKQRTLHTKQSVHLHHPEQCSIIKIMTQQTSTNTIATKHLVDSPQSAIKPETVVEKARLKSFRQLHIVEV
ncbi:unnamed protein product [Ilex paraguariensis]|uniref:Uncharacterized protein n=1 Tax=Ilex paraguariensis TaxID=185542 RepID=A0ABC8SKM5_9AQUA